MARTLRNQSIQDEPEASTVSRWRRDPEYLREVEQSIRDMAEDWMDARGADEMDEPEPE